MAARATEPRRIWSFVGRTVEQGGWSGVCRFDWLLRLVFPELRSVTECPDLDPDADLVITDNHLSLRVPAAVRTIVVHHGCAQTHYERDSGWRSAATRAMVEAQLAMFTVPNRLYLASSAWVRDEFVRHASLPADYAVVIPNWVPEIAGAVRPPAARPVVLGDWRDFNKGSTVFPAVSQLCPEYELRRLECTEQTREECYRNASVYLCLSLSEGGAYAVADAEAARLPIVTTPVGNYREFQGVHVIPLEARARPEVIAQAVRTAVQQGRRSESYYNSYDFGVYSRRLREAVIRAWSTELPPFVT